MNTFELYLRLGFEHIADINGYDHILFVCMLVLNYQIGQWKKLLVLITSFTLGHTVSLALAVTGILSVNAPLTEFLIPVTIFFTGIYTIFDSYKPQKTADLKKYFLVSVFGLIHGLGFSNYLQSLLGKSSSLAMCLFSFNLGLEIGQLLIVLFMLIFSFIFTSLLKAPERYFKLIIASAISGISLIMVLERYSQL